MATTEDIARLRLETVGTETLDALRTKLATVQAEMGDLAAAYARGEIAQKDFDGQVRALSDSHTSLSRGLKDLGGGLDDGRNKLAGFGQTALQTGRIVQDFYQGGVLGVLNNVESFVQALGGGAGLAGVLTVVGVGFSLLQPHIKDFIASLQGGIPRELLEGLKDLDQDLATAKDRFKELGEQSRLSLSEVMEYYKLRDQIKQQEQEQAERKQDAKLDTLSPAFDKEVAQGVQQAIAEGGGRGQAEEEIVQAQINAAESRGEGYQVEELRKNAAALLRDATAGTGQSQGARDQIASLLGKNIPGLPSSFEAGLGVFSPESAEADRQFDEQIAARQAAARRRDQARAAQNRLSDELTRQGQENEEAGEGEADKFDRMLNEQGEANEIEGQKQQEEDNKKARDTEAKRIQDTVGKQRQQEYEIAVAQNQARLTGGAPVARTAAEEQQLRGMNAAYALPPDVLARRLQGQLAQEFQQRGAAPGSAQQAAGAIAGAGQQDLQRRAAQFSGSTLNLQQQALMLTHELTQGYAQMNTHLQSLDREVKQQRAMVRNAHRRAR